MKVIDFRFRPPYGSFLTTIMYRDLDRAQRCSSAFGMTQSPSVKARDFEAALTEMDEAKISMAVLSGRKVLPHIGIVDNQDIVDLVNQYPDRFIGFAGIDSSDTSSALEEINHYVIDDGLSGVVLEPGLTKNPMFVDDEALFPIYELCQRSSIPAMLMVGSNCGPSIEYSKPEHVERLAQCFPHLPLILAHGGWPWVTETVHLAYRYKNIYILPDLYQFNCPGHLEYIAAANYILKDQMLFGSAYPYVSLKEAIEYFTNGRLSSEAQRAFFFNNAQKVLNLTKK